MKIIIKEEQYKSLLNEIISGEIYHYTYPSSLYSILKNNKINLSSGVVASDDNLNNKPFFLSLSRTKSLKLGFGGDKKTKMMSRIVFDADKLNSRFKTAPVDYWGQEYKHYNSFKQFEYEERILSDKPTIPNISNYIKRIEIVITDIDTYEDFIKWFKAILSLSQKLNIPVNIYASETDLNLNRNRINDIILNKDSEEIEDNKRFTFGVDNEAKKILAIVLYKREYMDHNSDVNLLCEKFEIYKQKNDIKIDITCSELLEEMRRIFFNFRDYLNDLSANLHNIFKSGRGGEIEKELLLLTREMKKYKVSNLEDLFKIKTHDLEPKGEKKNYAKIYSFFKKIKNEWSEIDNNSLLKNLGLFFTSYTYGGFIDDSDYEVYDDMKRNDKTVGDWINYLMNIYTIEKVKEIVHKAGYSEYYDKYNWKIDKK